MIEKEQLFKGLAALRAAKVLCVGDIMLDRYIYGSINRISPEAPVPVLRVDREKHMLGGVGNVAANLAALGVGVTVVSVWGADAAGDDIARQLQDAGIRPAGEQPAGYTTTVKSRFVSGMQQMLRVDREKTDAPAQDTQEKIIRHIEREAKNAGVIVLSDYGKGLLTADVIAAAIKAGAARGIPVVVDPKGRDFSRYRGASFITPNRRELEEATGQPCAGDADVVAAAAQMTKACGIGAALVTRSKDGMSLVSKDAPALHIPARVREVFDVSGAGDTVIAVFAAGLAAGLAPAVAAHLSNIAAGIVVGKPGTATAQSDEILAAIESDGGPARKIATAEQAAAAAQRLKARGLKTGFTNGCFDLLHPGHLSLLRQARAQCDFLIVAINSDASVRRIKGPARPVQDQKARADILSALDVVDMVVVFDDDTPLSLIRAVAPDVLVKGGQYKLEDVVGYDVVAAYGGKVFRADMEEGFSTTGTIAKISG